MKLSPSQISTLSKNAGITDRDSKRFQPALYEIANHIVAKESEDLIAAINDHIGWVVHDTKDTDEMGDPLHYEKAVENYFRTLVEPTMDSIRPVATQHLGNADWNRLAKKLIEFAKLVAARERKLIEKEVIRSAIHEQKRRFQAAWR